MARSGNPEQNPTLRGRRLAMELQRRREATGTSREEVARQLEWSTSTIFRIFRNGPIELDPDEVERLLEVRLARQEILARDDRPRLWAVIDEAVIHRVVGSAEVMRGQLRHLADAAQQGKTTIQVVPYRASAHAGTTGPFVILDFEEPTDPAMVYVETLAGDIYLEERSDMNRYTLSFDRLRAASLHPDDSVQLIEQAASTLT